MEFFQDLGKVIGQRWKACDYDERKFAQIAYATLSEFRPHEYVSLQDVVKLAMISDHIPFQVDMEAKFGDPPLTVYVGRGFRIEVLFWLSGVPTIHQHSFSGAFYVMRGSSIHSLWTFAPRERIQTHLLVGNISLRHVEVLERGDVRHIWAGSEMYHSTFHIDKPSVSIVIRTVFEVDKLPQYDLLPPCIARASQMGLQTVQRQIQIMQMLVLSGNRTDYQHLMRHLVATKDAQMMQELLLSTYVMIEDQEERDELLRIAGARHPSLLDAIRPVLGHEFARQRLLQLQRNQTTPDLKYFVALLLNVPDGKAIAHLVNKRFPLGDPVTTICRLVRQLSESGTLKARLSESHLAALQHALVCRVLGREEAPGGQANVGRLLANLRESWLLGPLFRCELGSSQIQLRKECSPVDGAFATK